MLLGRKDHACAFVKIDEEKGVLVSGGVDSEDNLLDSVEFYSLENQEWTDLSPLKRARTEHGMAMIGGLVTVIGGVSKTEFLASIEVLDNSANSDENPLGHEWRVAAHSLAAPRYDFALAVAPVSYIPNYYITPCMNQHFKGKDIKIYHLFNKIMKNTSLPNHLA